MTNNPYRRDSSDDEPDLDEECFLRTYKPLSNLPTPPASARHPPPDDVSRCLLQDGETFESAMLGPAVHLANLIPPAASLATPSVPVIQSILTRANLSLDTIALAVCILDSLPTKFALRWRLACPLAPQPQPLFPARSSSINKRHTIHTRHDSNPTTQRLHIDTVPPEIIALAALILAVKFLDDNDGRTDGHSVSNGSTPGGGEDPEGGASLAFVCTNGMWTAAQLAFTERCVMEALDYRILPLLDADLIADALADMERAGKQVVRQWEREAKLRGQGGESAAGGGEDEGMAAATKKTQKDMARVPMAEEHHRRSRSMAVFITLPAEMKRYWPCS